MKVLVCLGAILCLSGPAVVSSAGAQEHAPIHHAARVIHHRARIVHHRLRRAAHHMRVRARRARHHATERMHRI